MNPQANWRFEKQSAHLYRVIAKKEKRPEVRQLFTQLAGEAEKQAALWEGKFTPGLSPTHFTPDWKTWFTTHLVNILGPRHLSGLLSAMKVRGMAVYRNPMAFHSKPHHISQVGQRHHQLGASNWLRAGVFGINDGLVSNASLIVGVAGAAQTGESVLLAGTAGLLAGALSMACGEYVSVKSQREFLEKQMEIEKEELENYPEEEALELALIYEAKGLLRADAERTAKALIANPEKALDTLAREELGINPSELGSPYSAAASSCISFTLGASIPLVPLLWIAWPRAFHFSIGFALVSLFVVGAAIGVFTGKSALYGGMRMLVLGSIAGGLTFLIGTLLA